MTWSGCQGLGRKKLVRLNEEGLQEDKLVGLWDIQRHKVELVLYHPLTPTRMQPSPKRYWKTKKKSDLVHVTDFVSGQPQNQLKGHINRVDTVVEMEATRKTRVCSPVYPNQFDHCHLQMSYSNTDQTQSRWYVVISQGSQLTTRWLIDYFGSLLSWEGSNTSSLHMGLYSCLQSFIPHC